MGNKESYARYRNSAKGKARDERGKTSAVQLAYRERIRTDVDAQEKRKAQSRKVYLEKPEVRRRVRSAMLLRKYGITIEQYEEIYNHQEGKCEICGKFFPVLAVDHNHATGQIRGLLCRDCNAGFGLLKEDIEILNNAIVYKRKYW